MTQWHKHWILRMTGTLLGALVTSVTFSADKDPALKPECKHPLCSRIAIERPWPRVDVGGYQQIDFADLRLMVPDGEFRLTGTQERMLLAYDNGKLVAVDQYTRAKLPPFLAGTNISLRAWMDIIFTRTPADKLPTNAKDAEAWKWSLTGKPDYLGGAQVSQFQNGQIVVYAVFDYPDGSYQHRMWFMVESNPDTIYYVGTNGLDEKTVLDILGSVSFRQNAYARIQ